MSRAAMIAVAFAAAVVACRSRPEGSGSADAVPPPADTGKPRPAPASPESLPTIRSVLASGVSVGQRIRISGRCLGYSVAAADGGPPLTRSDWQLEDDGVAIYVSGPLPQNCSAIGGSTERTTIDAVVAQDTLPALGDRLPGPRRYLIRTTR